VAKYRLHNTAHVLRRVDMRNLSLENVKNVVNYPDKEIKVNRPGRHGGKVRTFEKTVDGITLKVVAEIKGSDCWLMTAYELG